jgi:hypothetical protein
VWSKPNRDTTPSTSTSSAGGSFAGIEEGDASLHRFLGLKAGALQSDDWGVPRPGGRVFEWGLKQT